MSHVAVGLLYELDTVQTLLESWQVSAPVLLMQV